MQGDDQSTNQVGFQANQVAQQQRTPQTSLANKEHQRTTDQPAQHQQQIKPKQQSLVTKYTKESQISPIYFSITALTKHGLAFQKGAIKELIQPCTIEHQCYTDQPSLASMDTIGTQTSLAWLAESTNTAQPTAVNSMAMEPSQHNGTEHHESTDRGNADQPDGDEHNGNTSTAMLNASGLSRSLLQATDEHVSVLKDSGGKEDGHQ